MVNPIMLEILRRQVENGAINIEDIKIEEYKNAVLEVK